MGVELELPEDTDCPLCDDERVELRENKAGRPYFTCRTFKTTVNLNADDAEEKLADKHLDVSLEEAEEPDDEDDNLIDLNDLMSDTDDS